MSIYTAVVSLMQDLEQLVSSYHCLFRSLFHPFTEEDIEILYNSVCLMDSFLRDSSDQCYSREFIDQLSEKRILDVAHKAGSYVDFWAVGQCLPGYRSGTLRELILLSTSGRTRLTEITEEIGQCLPGSGMVQKLILLDTSRRIDSGDQGLTEITEEIASINEELKKIRDSSKTQDFEIASSTGKFPTSSSPLRRTSHTDGKLVGLEKDLVMMLDRLTGYALQMKVLPITGMGGVGKTTFARKLYDDPLVVHHFYVRVWVTVSQQYQVREMLLRVLHCVTIVSDEIHGRSDEELREQVYKNLKGKRFLIVLDDIWDAGCWNELRRTFPDDKNGSRIMLTSRIRDVAVHASQDTPPHCLQCLNMHQSWELLRSKIFGDESCPLELVKIGEEIAYKCQGLPLALVVVGGLLSKMNTKRDAWEKVVQSVRSLVMEEPGCADVLTLSYSHMPDHLKACFLYLGIFPEDYEIAAKKLIRLWIAEGFVRPDTIKSLEEVAEDYLEDLITRSLIQVKRKTSDGRIKICSIHDMMRELCLKESQKQNFLHVINRSAPLPPLRLHDEPLASNLRRLSFHSRTGEYINITQFSYIRSFISFENLSFSNSTRSGFGKYFKLLKVLDIMNIRLPKIPGPIKNLILLKFVALTVEDSSHITDLFMLRSLQTLIIDCEWDGYLPRIFWDMLELGHFHLKRSCLSYSRSHPRPLGHWVSSTSVLESADPRLPFRVLKNLRSMSTIRPISCTEKIFLSMPHLKKLGVYETEEDEQFRGWFKMLLHLKELKSLKYVFSNPFVSSKPDRLPQWYSFPPKLVKLTLSGTSLPWEDMLKLCMLPKLEVLKLRNYAFSGAVWKSTDGGFRSLRYLLVGSTNLEIWEADGTHFPKLNHLALRNCRSLKEIPYGIGEAPLLETIELHNCMDSAVVSARQIQEEQQSFGIEGLVIYITK